MFSYSEETQPVLGFLKDGWRYGLYRFLFVTEKSIYIELQMKVEMVCICSLSLLEQGTERIQYSLVLF